MNDLIYSKLGHINYSSKLIIIGMGGAVTRMGGPVRAGRPMMGSLAAVAPICAKAPVLLTISTHGSKTLFSTIYLSQEIHIGDPRKLLFLPRGPPLPPQK